MKNKNNKILAKPSGIPLQIHTQNVLEEGQYLLKAIPTSIKKYFQITGKDLAKRLRGAIKFHDVGKSHPAWQEACRKDYDNYKKWNEVYKGNFSEFSKQNRDLAGKYLRRSGVRHEISSLDLHYNDGFSKPVKVAIAAHHSKLSRKYKRRWIDNYSGENSSQLWSEFVGLSANSIRNFHDFKKAIALQYEFSGVRSFLQLADHRASAREEGEPVIELKHFLYKFPSTWIKRNVQNLAEKYADEDLLLLRAPTGAGKTDACLLWASKQIENERADRLIIAMPTRFTSNALSINVAETLSDTGLYHSSAWFNKFNDEIKEGTIARNIAKKEHELARKLLTPVTVCTVDHLLMSLTLTREDHHTILFNLANSCVVIDEADFYDEFTQANILVLLDVLKMLKVPVMIMSASLPESSLKMYNSIGYSVTKIREDKSDLKRDRVEIKEIREYENLDELDDLLHRCLTVGTAIIYANTVARAMEFFNWFKKRGTEPILYHSRFTEPHKKEKEEVLLKALGKKAWEDGTARGIAILTQIGEMSVNISADIMISEICPIDRLVQRAGRLCRFDKNKIGELYLLIPLKDDEIYPAPYGTYKPKVGWEPNEALIKTREKIRNKKYSAGDFVELINEVYSDFKTFNSKAINNAKLLKEMFISNWLILPLEQSREDDTDSQFWRSRDIIGNETVFVEYPEFERFFNWSNYQEYKLENSIDISSYLVQKGIKENRIIRKEVFINDEDILINVALNSYDFEIGLHLTNNSKDDQFL